MYKYFPVLPATGETIQDISFKTPKPQNLKTSKSQNRKMVQIEELHIDKRLCGYEAQDHVDRKKDYPKQHLKLPGLLTLQQVLP